MCNTSEQYKGYTPCKAQKRAEERRKESGKRYGLKTQEIGQHVHEGLNNGGLLGWTPGVDS